MTATPAMTEFEVLDQQAQMVEWEDLFGAAYGGVGAGKTLGAQIKMWKRMLQYPRAGHYVVGPDFENLRTGYFPDFRQLLEDVFNWREGKEFKYRENPRPQIIFLRSGSRLRSLSSEIAERIRGTNIQTLHCEEPQTWHNGEQVYNTLIGRLRHSLRSGKIYPDMPIQTWLTFNPKDCPIGSWLHRLVTEVFPKHNYPVLRFSLRDNYLMENHQQVVKNLEDTLAPSMVPVEIDGYFPTLGGGAYREFNADVHCNLGAIPDGLPPMGLRNAPLLWALDFNVAFMCSVIAQAFVQQPIVEYVGHPIPKIRMPVEGWQKRTFYIIDEICKDDGGTGRGVGIEDVVTEFLKRYEGHAKQYGLTIYGDATGSGRSQQGSGSDAVRTNWEAVLARLRAVGIQPKMKVPKANPSIGDRLNMMNRQLTITTGYGMLIDPLRCPELIADLVQNKIDPKTGKLDKSDESELGKRRTHTGDACGYMVYVERKLEAGQMNPQNFQLFR